MEKDNSFKLYLRLLTYVKPYWHIFAISLLGMAITAATEPLLPALLKPMLDGTFVHKDDFVITWAPVFILVIFFVRGVASFIGSYAISWVGTRLVLDLRKVMFAKLLALPTHYYDDHASGNLLSKLTYDVTQVTQAATNVVTVIVKDSIIMIGLLGWLFYLNWKLTLLTLLMAPIITWLIRTLNKRMRSSSRDIQRAMGDMTQILGESLGAHKVVKLFGGQSYEMERFAFQANRQRQYQMKQSIASSINVPLVQMIAAIALAIIVWLATSQAQADETTIGSFLSFIAAMLMLTSPLKRLTSVTIHIQRGLAAAESVFSLIDTVEELDTGTQRIERAKGHLVFEQVSLSYRNDEHFALRDLSLDIPAGKIIALVGHSGSGKTTLANLVPRFYHPTSGRILLDGYNLEDIEMASLRDNISLVSQDVVLFNDTVFANIAYGQMREVSQEEVERAAHAAHAYEFIQAMPQGFDTLVGEKGVRLSGGQRQRIAIARALLKNSPILILDEATSALDSEAERHVQAALEVLMKNRTTLVIAHRLSTIEKADRIVVMHHGQIVEQGSHSELIAKSGAYANLHRIQFRQDED